MKTSLAIRDPDRNVLVSCRVWNLAQAEGWTRPERPKLFGLDWSLRVVPFDPGHKETFDVAALEGVGDEYRSEQASKPQREARALGRRERYQRAAARIQAWLDEEDDSDLEVWPQIEDYLRLNPIRLREP